MRANLRGALRALPYVLTILIAFYLLPLGISDTASGMMILLVAIPVLCFLAAFLLGWRIRFLWWFALLVAALFVPTIWIYYNTSAWVYALIYAVFALAGIFFGGRMPRR